MSNQKTENLTFTSIAKDLRQNAFSLIGADITFKMISFVILSPLISLLLRLFLWISGRPVLADTDIVLFLLHPVGWVTAVVVGGALLGVQALQQAALISVVLANTRHKSLRLITVFRFLCDRASELFRLTMRIVIQILLTAAPFLIVGGVLYLLLLTDHDINFYLTQKPPRFWLAVATIGIDLFAMVIIIVWKIVGWSFALQLVLFEKIPVAEAMSVSRSRIKGHKRTILKMIGLWISFCLMIAIVLAFVVILVSQSILPDVESPLWQIVLSGAIVMVLFVTANYLSSLIATLSLSVVLTRLYLSFADHVAISLPNLDDLSHRIFPKITTARLVTGLIVSIVLVCATIVVGFQSVKRDTHVQVTAHRGASGDAPENTLASVNLAIEKGADWVEIDVQETKDGVVVVAHDSDLKKVAGESVKIWEATADELRQIDIGSYFDPKFKDERVPTLAEVLETCRGEVGLIIELKYYGHDQQLEQRVVDLVEQSEMQDNVMFMSLKLAGVQKLKKLRPDWKIGLLTAVTVSDLTRADVDFLAVKTSLATSSLIQQAHLRGKDVATWTVNDELAMATMIRRGADNLITDYPALAKQVIEKQEALTPAESFLFDLALLLGEDPLIHSAGKSVE